MKKRIITIHSLVNMKIYIEIEYTTIWIKSVCAEKIALIYVS